jgi:SAM-dependent methyltransferase
MKFQDYFSRQATLYAQFRPVYPGKFFDYLASICSERKLAWDCATGNGQAAIELARRFRKVIATDPSSEQIKHAFQHAQVEYHVEAAEQTSIRSNRVDLTTVGTAVHWFDLERFYAEVRRVSKPEAPIAVWTYHLPKITLNVDRSLAKLYWETLGSFWPQNIHLLEDGYQSLPFPFKEIRAPEFFMQAKWELKDLVGFIASWSAARRYVDAHGEAALEEGLVELAQNWGEPNRVQSVKWRLFARIGLVS